MMVDPAQLLPWDTQFFGKRIGRVSETQLTDETVKRLDTWAAQQNIDCLYLLLNADDPGSINLAEQAGYFLRDIRLTFQLKRPQLIHTPEPGNIRLSRPDDVNALRHIARTAYSNTRFYNDPCFPVEKCDEMYEIWLVSSLTSDFASAVTVAEWENVAAGYITMHYDPGAKTGRIGLVGVSPDVQGRGIGRMLMQHTLHWFWQQNAEEVFVATQGRNIGAQRLYQASGFRTANVELWFHRWYKDCKTL